MMTLAHTRAAQAAGALGCAAAVTAMIVDLLPHAPNWLAALPLVAAGLVTLGFLAWQFTAVRREVVPFIPPTSDAWVVGLVGVMLTALMSGRLLTIALGAPEPLPLQRGWMILSFGMVIGRLVHTGRHIIASKKTVHST